MTPLEEIKFIAERTSGECWHDWVNSIADCNTARHRQVHKCSLCGESGTGGVHLGYLRPGPHSLDDLVGLAEKNGYRDIDFYSESGSCTIYPNGRIVGSCRGIGETKADALRKALVSAIKQGEVEP